MHHRKKTATPAPAPKQHDIVLQIWSTLPVDGSGVLPTSEADQMRPDEIDHAEEIIEIMKK